MYNPQPETFPRAADGGSFNRATKVANITITAEIKQINLPEGSLGVSCLKEPIGGDCSNERKQSYEQKNIDFIGKPQKGRKF